MNEPVVVVPVFNAFADSRACLESVAQHSPGKRVIVVDDASTEGIFSWDPKGRVNLELVRGDKNLGFPGAANRGIELAGRSDVVLLNSDTLVTKGWLEKLHAAAYSDEKIGTVTPFTNRGSICSIPRFCVDSELPDGVTLEEWGTIIEESSTRAYPRLPSCVGHCLFLKRAALDLVGLFDAAAFGRGYGEENDLSCRMQQRGFVDVLDDATFVYHRGNASFQGERSKLQLRNQVVLEQRHPHYFDRVSRFCRADPLARVRERPLKELFRRRLTERPIVLHVVHNGPFISQNGGALGGTERHVQELITGAPEYTHCSLVPCRDVLVFTVHQPDFELRSYLPRSVGVLKTILSTDLIPFVHLHHSLNHPREELLSALRGHGNYLVSIHDYVSACPRLHFLRPDGKACAQFECESACGYEDGFIKAYRDSAQELLCGARKVVAFSKSSEGLLKRVFGERVKCEIVSHGAESLGVLRTPGSPESEGVLRVLILGSVVFHKGGEIYRKLFATRQIGDLRIEWHVLGDAGFRAPSENVISHGAFQAAELRDRIQQISPHLYLALSICPETYGRTVDEALSAGIPAVVGPLGAPQERVREWGAGWVLSELSAEAALAVLKRVITGDELSRTRERLSAMRFPSSKRCVEQHRLWYGEAAQPGARSAELPELLDRLSVAGPAVPGAVKRQLGALVSKSVYILDHLGVRRGVQRFVTRVLPERVVTQLKQWRT